MEQTIIFDTHRYVKRLTDAGLASPIAEVLAEEQAHLLERNLSTKEDIKQLELSTREDIKQLELSTKEDIRRLEISTKEDIKQLELSTREDIKRLEAKLETKLAETKVELIKWYVGTMLVFGGILVAAIKFL